MDGCQVLCTVWYNNSGEAAVRNLKLIALWCTYSKRQPKSQWLLKSRSSFRQRVPEIFLCCLKKTKKEEEKLKPRAFVHLDAHCTLSDPVRTWLHIVNFGKGTLIWSQKVNHTGARVHRHLSQQPAIQPSPLFSLDHQQPQLLPPNRGKASKRVTNQPTSKPMNNAKRIRMLASFVKLNEATLNLSSWKRGPNFGLRMSDRPKFIKNVKLRTWDDIHQGLPCHGNFLWLVEMSMLLCGTLNILLLWWKN